MAGNMKRMLEKARTPEHNAILSNYSFRPESAGIPMDYAQSIPVGNPVLSQIENQNALAKLTKSKLFKTKHLKQIAKTEGAAIKLVKLIESTGL